MLISCLMFFPYIMKIWMSRSIIVFPSDYMDRKWWTKSLVKLG